MIKKVVLLITILLSFYSFPLLGEETSENGLQGFLRYPHIHNEDVVFTSEGDLWLASKKGDRAYRLTTAEGEERFARFSPDGKWIAFSGEYGGNEDVYVISSQGGEPKRLTYHPSHDQVLGWTSDGKSVIFRSYRDAPNWTFKVYTVNTDGGYPATFPLDQCAFISFEPAGDRIAFNRMSFEFQDWKRYRGGWHQDIWVGNTKTLEFAKITDFGGTDAFPMWYKDRIYFLSDRGGRPNIFSMTPEGTDTVQHTFFEDYDVRWPALGEGGIIYQHGMDIWTYNPETGENQKLDIKLPSDRIQSITKFVDPSEYVTSFDISPDGNKALICSRGEIFSIPSREKGLIRRLTWSSGSGEKFPVCSPDGKTIALVSDSTGEEELYIYPADGKGEPKQLTFGATGWKFWPQWSPDGKFIAFGDKNLTLYIIEVATGNITVVDKDKNWEIKDYSWSPDSKWLAYSSWEDNWMTVIKIYNVNDKTIHQVTDPVSNSFSPSFSPDGKYLYFLSDIAYNPWECRLCDTFTYSQKSTLPCLILLKKDEISPFTPMIDKEEEKTEEEETEEEKVDVKIDFENISKRVIQFPIEAGDYSRLMAVKEGIYYLSSEYNGEMGGDFNPSSPAGNNLHMFDIAGKEEKLIATGTDNYVISSDLSTVMIHRLYDFMIMDTGAAEDSGVYVDLADWDLEVNPGEEWKQIFNEAWRLQRDFFYDPNMHGVDWEAVKKQYEALLPRISTRDELNDLIGEMNGELNVSHAYIWGGDQREGEPVSAGLLGASILPDTSSGYYKIEKIYRGDLWADTPVSPLEKGGAKEGEYIIAINGRPLSIKDNYLKFLVNKAEKQVSITINSTPSANGAREIIVLPLSGEEELIYMDWVRDRREFVENMSGGKIGYIHLPDMGGKGLSMFGRYYLPQYRKDGLIIDVRYNAGGYVAPMILSLLDRKIWAVESSGKGGLNVIPYSSFYGHMAFLCNQETGSDGETFSEGVKRLNMGPLIGMRTWGGWIGIRADKSFVDSGGISTPEFPGWDLNGMWMIEGWGVDPDVEIENDPPSVIKGGDPQLEYAIDYLMKKIMEEPPVLPPEPDFKEK